MKYVLLVQLPTDAAPPPDMQEQFRAYAGLKAELQAEGVWLGGQALEPANVTTQVRVRAGDTIVVDGPLAETSEQVAGYYLIDCRDLDEAISIAARVPGAAMGTVEVRPVFDYEALID